MYILAQWHAVAAESALVVHDVQCGQLLRRWCAYVRMHRSRTTRQLREQMARHFATARVLQRMHAFCETAHSAPEQRLRRIVAETHPIRICLMKTLRLWRQRASERALARLLAHAVHEKAIMPLRKLCLKKFKAAAAAAQLRHEHELQASQVRNVASYKLLRLRRSGAMSRFQSACGAAGEDARRHAACSAAFEHLLRWRRMRAFRCFGLACRAVCDSSLRQHRIVHLLCIRSVRHWRLFTSEVSRGMRQYAAVAGGIARLLKRHALQQLKRGACSQHKSGDEVLRALAEVRRKALSRWTSFANGHAQDAYRILLLGLQLSMQQRIGAAKSSSAAIAAHARSSQVLHGKRADIAQACRVAAASCALRRLRRGALSRGQSMRLWCEGLLRARGFERRTRMNYAFHRWVKRQARRRIRVLCARRRDLAILRRAFAYWKSAHVCHDLDVTWGIMARVQRNLWALRYAWLALSAAGSILTARRKRLAVARARFLEQGEIFFARRDGHGVQESAPALRSKDESAGLLRDRRKSRNTANAEGCDTRVPLARISVPNHGARRDRAILGHGSPPQHTSTHVLMDRIAFARCEISGGEEEAYSSGFAGGFV